MGGEDREEILSLYNGSTIFNSFGNESINSGGIGKFSTGIFGGVGLFAIGAFID